MIEHRLDFVQVMREISSELSLNLGLCEKKSVRQESLFRKSSQMRDDFFVSGLYDDCQANHQRKLFAYIYLLLARLC